MINAVKIVHPQTIVRGCYFNFSITVWREIKTVGLANLYRNSFGFKNFVQMCVVMPLVPIAFLNEAKNILISLKPINNDLFNQFYDNLFNTWFSENSFFAVDIWSHCKSDGPRTNNNAEGFHNKLNRMVKKSHPCFLKYCILLKKSKMKMKSIC
jgi:hypothetical protein